MFTRRYRIDWYLYKEHRNGAAKLPERLAWEATLCNILKPQQRRQRTWTKRFTRWHVSLCSTKTTNDDRSHSSLFRLRRHRSISGIRTAATVIRAMLAAKCLAVYLSSFSFYQVAKCYAVDDEPAVRQSRVQDTNSSKINAQCREL